MGSETNISAGGRGHLSDRVLHVARELGVAMGERDASLIVGVHPRMGGSHYLVSTGQDTVHLWLPAGEGSWSDHSSESLLRMVSEQLGCIEQRMAVEGMGGHGLVYSPIGQTNIGELLSPGGLSSPGYTVEDGRRVLLRAEAASGQVNIEYIIRPEPDMRTTFIMSRLSSKALRSVPELLGASYWTYDGGQRPWLRATRLPKGTGPAMRPFLQDLNELTFRFASLEGDRAKRFILGFLGSEQTPSLSAAFRLGLSLGELHGKVLFTPEEASSVRRGRSNSDLDALFMSDTVGMEQIGALVGCYSSCQANLRKGLTRVLGDPEPSKPSGQRKLKVVKRKGRAVRGEGMELLMTLRSHLIRETGNLRSLVMGLKALKGSPTVLSSIDARLDRMEMAPDGQFIFKRFDFSLLPSRGRSDDRTTALKDLSLLLNSFMKVRFLCASSMMKRASSSLNVPHHELEAVLADYNMAKRGHRAMLADLPVWLRIGHRETVFKCTYAASLVGSVWYERARNQLVSGYNMGVGLTGRNELLEYPEKVDTVECMRSLQCLAALSSASEAIGGVEGPRSNVGLSNDLFTALIV